MVDMRKIKIRISSLPNELLPGGRVYFFEVQESWLFFRWWNRFRGLSFSSRDEAIGYCAQSRVFSGCELVDGSEK